MERRKNILLSGVIFVAAAVAAVAAALSCTAAEKTAELRFTETLHSCDHSEYTDTYDAVERAKHGTVRILSLGGDSLSTAFAVGKPDDEAEYFLTAYHGVKDGDINLYTGYMAEASIKDGKITYDHNIGDDLKDNCYKAELVAYDENYDIALIKTSEAVKNVFPLKILDSCDKIIQGEAVYGLTFPVSEDRISARDGFKKARYADSDSVTVLEGKTAVLFEDQEDFLHLEMDLSGGCSGGPVILKNGAVAGMVKQGNFSIIIDPVLEMEIYEPSGSGTAVKSEDISTFLEKNDIEYESAGKFVQAGCDCEFTEKDDVDGMKRRDEIYRMLKQAEVLSTLLFGVLNIIACGILLKEDGDN